jgi:hypothetical protein
MADLPAGMRDEPKRYYTPEDDFKRDDTLSDVFGEPFLMGDDDAGW